MQWLMLQQDQPKDYVIASGQMKSVREFIELSAKKIGWGVNPDEPAIIWEGEGINEIGRRADTNQIVIRIDKRYFRPTEVERLLGDATKAKNILNWTPQITLEDLVSEMIENDSDEAKKESYLRKKGFNVNSPFENPPNIKK